MSGSLAKLAETTKRVINWLFKTKLGFYTLVVVLFWLKTYIVYLTKFNLGVEGSMQHFLLLFNPIPTGMLLLGIGLFFKGRKSYWITIVIDLVLTFWLFANILYYREFSDFLSMSIIKSSGSASDNLGNAIFGILLPSDFLAFTDVLLLIGLVGFKVIKIDVRVIKFRISLIVMAIASLLIGLNLTMAQKDRSGLLTRTFDNNYIVKYLGIDTFAVYDAVKTAQTSAVMAKANASDLKTVQDFLAKNKAATNASYHGVLKGKNVFVIHLESFQQFLLNYKSNGVEVTPNLNKLIADQNTLSFDNFYNQVGQGKTSDAEMMMENSLFGLPSGSAMSGYGTSNTFEAAPAILGQQGYTNAVLHGGTGSFWNRENTYKSWGYDFFYSLSAYENKKGYYLNYGLKDKIFLQQSSKYIEQLPQPFYSKIITVTNHYPYPLDKENQTIEKTTTGDKTVDGYVQTAHYLDQAIGEFITWLKKVGLYNNSMIVLYGDHYGISSNHPEASEKLVDQDEFTDFDALQFQKVPFIIHSPGLKGGVNHTYGGEIDAMPTIMNLLGVDDSGTIQFGNDLTSPANKQIVAMRNGDFVTPKYARTGSDIYNTKTGKKIKKLTAKQKQEVAVISNYVTSELSLSDRVITGDLLRFYEPKWFKKVDRTDFSYNLEKMQAKLDKLNKEKKTSVLVKNNNKSTVDQYVTDAPELKD